MIGLKRQTVQVVAHDPSWATLAAAACHEMQRAGGDLLADVQHVGSTAVPGLPAKPILDLTAGVRTLEAIPEIIRRLTAIGYLYRGDEGDAGGHLFLRESAPDIRTIHLHVVEYNGNQWKNDLLFRNLLRQDAQLRQQYAKLKQRLAGEFGNNRKAYTAAKKEFIHEVLHSHTKAQPLERTDLRPVAELNRLTTMRPTIRQAKPQDSENVAGILREAAQWLEQRGMALWRADELLSSRIAADVAAGLFFIAECDGEAAGVVKFQLEDALIWPDVPQTQSAFVHRLAIRRRFAGGGISSALLSWAVQHARSLGRSYLRLDCGASRPRLRRVYEQFGFRHHSDRQVGQYFVSRYEYDVTDRWVNVVTAAIRQPL
ncbi:MAG: GNAT family N-acetyltransferase [Verrucomicrobiota bacterium]